jgi:hypothetical protein
MQKDVIRTAAVVFVAALAGLILYEGVWGMSRGASGLHWQPVAEGALIGLSAVLAMLAAQTRLAAAAGLVVVALLILGGTTGILPLTTIHAPVTWALGTGLLVRVVVQPVLNSPPAEDRGGSEGLSESMRP